MKNSGYSSLVDEFSSYDATRQVRGVEWEKNKKLLLLYSVLPH